MKIQLLQTILENEERYNQIQRELEVLDEKLKTPEHTVDDIIRHMYLLKEKNTYFTVLN